MKRLSLVAYGAVAYILFNIAFVYMIGFLIDLGVPKAVNDGSATPIALAVFILSLIHI